MSANPPETQLNEFIDRYTHDIAEDAREILARMREWLPGALELVYDNYNALVVGFGPTERSSEAIFSIALYPRWVTLFFLQGAQLSDEEGLLKGDGKIVRHIVLKKPDVLDLPGVRSLMAQALDKAPVPLDPRQQARIIIKSISPKQRPRRPAGR